MIRRKNTRSSTEVKVLAQHICMSVFKARKVIDQIRGHSYADILMILELMLYWASYPILKLVYFTASNVTHNVGLKEVNLFISQAEVNGGAIMKKIRPRVRELSYPIKRSTCHIKIIMKNRRKSFINL